ncbi:MAG: hypothetical protein ACKV2Q_01265 [Planctomycetaceae bacterium]
MKFTVVWLARAEHELAELWEASPDRAAVSRAANRIEQTLARLPYQAGEERPDGRRVLFDKPLGILFRVFLDDRLVRVTTVWDITRR